MADLLDDPEFSLLVAATARPPAPRHVATIAAVRRGAVDWPRFLKLVDRHRVAPLAFDGLTGIRSAIPDDAYGELRAKAMRDRANALQLVGILVSVTTKLANAGIEAVAIKGPTLALLTFGDVSLRHCRDLDILISPDHVGQALAVLKGAGFRVIEPDGLDAPDRLAAWAHLMKDASLLHEATGALVELHWRLNNNPHLLPPAVATSRQSVDIGPIRTVTLAPDDLLLYLCIHGAKHLWFRLKWLADVHALLGTAGPAAAVRLVEQADRRGAGIAVRQMLMLLRQVYGLSVPEMVAVPHARRIRRLTRWARQALQSVDEPNDRRFGNMIVQLAQMQLRPDLRYVAREIAGLAVDWPMVAGLGGRRWAYPLAVFGRPFFWTVRKLRPRRLP